MEKHIVPINNNWLHIFSLLLFSLNMFIIDNIAAQPNMAYETMYNDTCGINHIECNIGGVGVVIVLSFTNTIMLNIKHIKVVKIFIHFILYLK